MDSDCDGWPVLRLWLAPCPLQDPKNLGFRTPIGRDMPQEAADIPPGPEHSPIPNAPTIEMDSPRSSAHSPIDFSPPDLSPRPELHHWRTPAASASEMQDDVQTCEYADDEFEHIDEADQTASDNTSHQKDSAAFKASLNSQQCSTSEASSPARSRERRNSSQDEPQRKLDSSPSMSRPGTVGSKIRPPASKPKHPVGGSSQTRNSRVHGRASSNGGLSGSTAREGEMGGANIDNSSVSSARRANSGKIQHPAAPKPVPTGTRLSSARRKPGLDTGLTRTPSSQRRVSSDEASVSGGASSRPNSTSRHPYERSMSSRGNSPSLQIPALGATGASSESTANQPRRRTASMLDPSGGRHSKPMSTQVNKASSTTQHNPKEREREKGFDPRGTFESSGKTDLSDPYTIPKTNPLANPLASALTIKLNGGSKTRTGTGSKVRRPLSFVDH